MTMKHKLLIGLGLVAIGALIFAIDTTFLSKNGVASDETGEIIELRAEVIFTPEGFDDNDNAQVVLDGWLPTSCDRLIGPDVKVDAMNGIIEVKAKAVRNNNMCMPIATRFTSVVDIGMLSWGDYKVVTNNGELSENLLVKEAENAGPDDFQYANVTKAWVDFAPDYLTASDSRWAVVVEGEFTNSCQRLKEIKVHDSGNTVEVQPLIEEEGEACLPVLSHFVNRAAIPEFENPGRYLLHVRSHDGKALNKVFTVYGNIGE